MGFDPFGGALGGAGELLGQMGKEWLQSKLGKSKATTYGSTRFGQPMGVFVRLGTGKLGVVPVNHSPATTAEATNLLNAFLSRENLIEPGSGPFAPLGVFVASRVVAGDVSASAVGSTRSSGWVDLLSERPLPRTAEDGHCAYDGVFARNGSGPVGEFFKTSLLRAKLAPLPSGVYGQIRMGQMPFSIEINSNVVDSRQKVSFVHETLHAITELQKLGLSHEQLHALSIFLTTEVIPGYLALERKLKSHG